MDNNEKKPEDLFERLKGRSVFSFLKAADGSPGGVPPPGPEPLTRPESSGQTQSAMDLKSRLAEMEEKIKHLEKGAAIQGEPPEFLRGIESRLAALESAPATTPGKNPCAQELEEKLKEKLAGTEVRISALLEKYRSSGEDELRKMKELVTELGRAADHDRLSRDGGEAEADRRLKLVEVELGDTLEQIAAALDRALKDGEKVLRCLLAEEQGLREKSALLVDERLEKLENEAVLGRREHEAVQAELSRLGEEFKGGFDVAHRALESAKERDELLELTLAESKSEVEILLAEGCRLREEAAAEVTVRLGKLEQETMALKTAMDEISLDMQTVRADVIKSTDSVIQDGRERLEGLAGKLQGDVMAAAGDKFSTLRTKWEAAAVEIHNAQKTAYCALEKCEKLDKSLFFLDLKTGALERKCSCYIPEQPKSGSGG